MTIVLGMTFSFCGIFVAVLYLQFLIFCNIIILQCFLCDLISDTLEDLIGEKYYKPIIKDGDHILRSKTNPNRVRGLTRDANNSNPDIIEWEEVEVETNDESDTYEDEDFQPSPEQEQLATAIANLLIVGGTLFVGKVIVPWWNKTAWPWVRNRAKDLRAFFRKNNNDKITNRIGDSSSIVGPVPSQYVDISSMIDSEFESIYIDMDKEEANKHIMKLVYHMLGVANEIRILSISHIKKECESDEVYIEYSKETKTYLAKKSCSQY